MLRTLTVLSLLLASTAAFAEEAAVPAKESAPAASVPAAAPVESLKIFTYAAKPTDVVYGKEDATVLVVEYASLSCPHCAAFFRDVLPDVQKHYIESGKVKFVYRNFPLNQPAMDAAQMLGCAAKESRPTFIKVLFSTQEKWAYDANYRESLAGIAVLGGMDRKTFDECMADKAKQDAVLLEYQEAKETFKIQSTPTLFVDGTALKGSHSFATVSKAINEALAAKAKK